MFDVFVIALVIPNTSTQRDNKTKLKTKKKKKKEPHFGNVCLSGCFLIYTLSFILIYLLCGGVKKTTQLHSSNPAIQPNLRSGIHSP